jgi:hypothetical protein
VVSRLASVAGAAGALAATVANLGCCGVGLLGPAAALAGLAGVLAPVAGRWGYEAMYVSLAVTLIALGASAWRLRRAYALLPALGGTVALLLAFHEAWSVGLFGLLVAGGSVALAAAVIVDVLFARRARRGALAGAKGTCAI